MRLRLNLIGFAAALFLFMGCYKETDEAGKSDSLEMQAHIALTFITPNEGSTTRSAVEDPDGYEAGIEYEDEINIDGGDFRIFFFTYSQTDEKGGTLIAEFKPEEVTTSSTASITTYTLVGDVPQELRSESAFRVVMLANWGGSYPSVTPGSTTIDELVEGANTTYAASNKFFIDAKNLSPFYGIQEYTGVEFKVNETTMLNTPVNLLRAVAKVEVLLTAESAYEAFENVEIVNYNSRGYCAPWGVYTAADYDTTAQKNPNTSAWAEEWVADLHLVGGANDVESKTQGFTHISGTALDTWRIYVPEYRNTGEDFSYICVTLDGMPYEIYFAEYLDGATDNEDLSKRYDIKRNNLYRFYITVLPKEEEEVSLTLRVWVEKWVNCFDNEYIFGIEDN